MMSDFGKIRRRNGSFLAGDIFLDRLETIRVAGRDDGTVNGLEFILSSESRITDHWRGWVESQTSHFHVIFLQNGLRFPLFGFVLELLYDYDIAHSQLAPNAWRILWAFYLGCHILGIVPTCRLFKNFYFLKTRE